MANEMDAAYILGVDEHGDCKTFVVLQNVPYKACPGK